MRGDDWPHGLLKKPGRAVLPPDNDDWSPWPEYYREFPYLSEHKLRPGCQPRKLLHGNRTENAVILVHGLSDSPFYMRAIGEYFYQGLGYDVYLPLLQCHGLREPHGMAGVSLSEWKKNVRFALRSAAEKAARVSIGGLSTGGTLGLYLSCTDAEVTGDLYLFSAALGIYAWRLRLLGTIMECLLRTPLVRFLDGNRPLSGHNPYRYARVPLTSAGELARLLKEIESLPEPAIDRLRAKRIFAAWSESDRVISVPKLHDLQALVGAGRFTQFVFPRAERVDHASVVLQEPVYAIGSRPDAAPLEAASPRFAEMMAAMHRFATAI
jgi:esterase/lipase